MSSKAQKIQIQALKAESYYFATTLLLKNSPLKFPPVNADDLDASKLSEDDQIFLHFPVKQTLGLTTELTFKTVLSAFDVSESVQKKDGHDLLTLFNKVNEILGKNKIQDLVWESLNGYKAPHRFTDAMQREGRIDIDKNWQVYEMHLDELNHQYGLRPYRTRYQTAGEIVHCDFWILLMGLRATMDLFNQLDL